MFHIFHGEKPKSNPMVPQAEGAKPGTLPRHVDMPKEHVFDKKLKIWKKRQR